MLTIKCVVFSHPGTNFINLYYSNLPSQKFKYNITNKGSYNRN
jgi:hypothetical protein